jgi:hypothetical protein
MILTEDDITRALSNPKRYPEGLTVSGLDVKLRGGRVFISADRVDYGMFRLRDLNVVGRLEAVDGQLQIEVEQVSPVGLVGAMIPQLANQAMEQIGSNWYVEQVKVGEGQVDVKFR